MCTVAVFGCRNYQKNSRCPRVPDHCDQNKPLCAVAKEAGTLVKLYNECHLVKYQCGTGNYDDWSLVDMKKCDKLDYYNGF